MAELTHSLETVSQGLDSVFHLTAASSNRFSRTEIKLVPARRMGFKEFQEEWRPLKAHLNANRDVRC
eukprot:6055772-Prorocentrum_lima.AAC.1